MLAWLCRDCPVADSGVRLLAGGRRLLTPSPQTPLGYPAQNSACHTSQVTAQLYSSSCRPCTCRPGPPRCSWLAQASLQLQEREVTTVWRLGTHKQAERPARAAVASPWAEPGAAPQTLATALWAREE